MAAPTTRHLNEPGPWAPSDWKPPVQVCAVCEQVGGLYLGDSDVCAGCEGDQIRCSACGNKPRASDLLCAECQAESDW